MREIVACCIINTIEYILRKLDFESLAFFLILLIFGVFNTPKSRIDALKRALKRTFKVIGKIG